MIRAKANCVVNTSSKNCIQFICKKIALLKIPKANSLSSIPLEKRLSFCYNRAPTF